MNGHKLYEFIVLIICIMNIETYYSAIYSTRWLVSYITGEKNIAIMILTLLFLYLAASSNAAGRYLHACIHV